MLFSEKQLTFRWIILLHTSDVKTPQGKHAQTLVFSFTADFFLIS